MTGSFFHGINLRGGGGFHRAKTRGRLLVSSGPKGRKGENCMKKMLEHLHLLQIFADGGEGGAGAGAGVSAEGAQAAAAGQPSGVGSGQEPAAAAGQGSEPTFAEMIAGKYKGDFDKEVSRIVRSRVKAAQEENTRLKEESAQWSEIGRYLQSRYGSDGKQLSVQELAQHIAADDYYVELEADRNGISAELQRKMNQERWGRERDQRELQALRQEQADREYFARVAREAEELKQEYPDFDLREALRDPDFMEWTKRGKSVKQVYSWFHHEEIVRAEQQKAAEAARQQTAASIASGAARPAENGARPAAPTTQQADPSKFSPEKMEKIRQAASRGEKVGPGHPLWDS